LKILIVTQYFWPENFKINDLAFELKNKGYEIDILTGIPNYPTGKIFDGYSQINIKDEVYNGINIYRTFIFLRGQNSRIRLFLNYLSFVIFGTYKILRLRKNYDAIFIYEPSPLTVAIPAIVKKKICKTPNVLWVTDLWPESVTATIESSEITKKLIYKLLNPLVGFIYKNVNKILVTSKAFISSIEKYSIKKNKIIFFPQWAEEIFRPMISKKNYLHNFNNNSFKIMFAGNLGEAQDFPAILDTANQLKDNKFIKWIILGDGRKKNWIKNKIIDYGLEDSFHMLGSHPLKKMPEFYSEADAMLLTLKKNDIFSKTIPAKLQSYLACGKPILGMIDGEASVIIKDSKCGLVCESGDSKQLALNISNISSKSSNELAQLGKNALNYYNTNFERKMLINRVENILINAINK